MERSEDYRVKVSSKRCKHGEYVRVCHVGRALLSRGSWWVCSDGYVRGRINGRMTTLHREVCYPEPSPGQQVDHVNRDRLDNRRANLRAVDTWINQHNKAIKPGRSRVRGVSKTARGTYRARITINGHAHALGEYKDPERARRAVEQARKDWGLT